MKLHPEYNHICEKKSGFYCGDCNTLVNCVEKKAIVESCAPKQFCRYKDSFSGAAVCYPEYFPKCSCSDTNVFQNDPYNVKAFFFCDGYGIPSYYKCPEEMIYDKYLEMCVHPEGLPQCTRAGVFPHEDDCRRYYTCIPAYTGWVQKLFFCPFRKMYNERNSQCENPCNWVQTLFKCKKEGRFPDRTNCQAFYECIKITSEKDFRMIKRKCPKGFHWQEESHQSNRGFCIREKLSRCEALEPTKCDVPPDWCVENGEEAMSMNINDKSIDSSSNYEGLNFPNMTNDAITNVNYSLITKGGAEIFDREEVFFSDRLNIGPISDNTERDAEVSTFLPPNIPSVSSTVKDNKTALRSNVRNFNRLLYRD